MVNACGELHAIMLYKGLFCYYMYYFITILFATSYSHLYAMVTVIKNVKK